MKALVTCSAIAAGLALGGIGSSAAHASTVPDGFIGMNLGGPAWDPGFPLEREVGVMARSGVQTVVVSFFWDSVQTGPDSRFNWKSTDRVVGTLASRKMTILPILFGLPHWAIRPLSVSGPTARVLTVDPDLFAAYAEAAALRYGPEGSFWDENPGIQRLPIRQWQVWNEPMMGFAWPDETWVEGYVDLLESGFQALKRVDPQAKVDIAGLTYRSWEYLDLIYKAGGGKFFDRVSLHPYSAEVGGVVEIVRRVRRVMTARKDDRPIIVSELSWPSASGKIKPKFGYEVSEKLQSDRVSASFRDLARLRKRLGVVGVAWFTWASFDTALEDPFDYAGLSVFRSGRMLRKPALSAFRTRALRMRGCAAFGPVVGDCQRR